MPLLGRLMLAALSLQSAPSREAVPIVAPLIREQEEDVGFTAGDNARRVYGYECQKGEEQKHGYTSLPSARLPLHSGESECRTNAREWVTL